MGRVFQRFFEDLFRGDLVAWTVLAIILSVLLLFGLFCLKIAYDHRKEDERLRRKRFGKGGSDRPRFADSDPPPRHRDAAPAPDEPTAFTAQPDNLTAASGSSPNRIPPSSSEPEEPDRDVRTEGHPRRRRVVRSPSRLQTSGVTPLAPILLAVGVASVCLCTCLPLGVLAAHSIIVALWPPPAGAGPSQDQAPRPGLPFERRPREYLSDLQEFDVKADIWGFARNGNVGVVGHRIKVNGVPSPKGLGMFPPANSYSAVKYRLGRRAALFKAVAAISDEVERQDSAPVFEVLGDGRRLWQSAPVRRPRQPQECSIDVTGVDVLELRVHCDGSNFGVHAVWVEPRVLQKADTPDRGP